MAQFVIGDIHGGHRALMQILERAPIEHGDALIFLGDYLDGWSEGPEVIDALMELSSVTSADSFVAITTPFVWII